MQTLVKWFLLSISMIIITACGSSNSKEQSDSVTYPVKIKKTGQTKSYNKDGSETKDRSIKDDGYYQIGVDQNYTRDDAKNIVTDHVTGLVWQDNAETKTLTKPLVLESNCHWNNGDEDCNDTSGDTAKTYCENLNLGDFNDWRVPTINEMHSIILANKYGTALDTSVFLNIPNQTATTYAAMNGAEISHLTNTPSIFGKDAMLVIDTQSGLSYNNDKANSYYLRCVRQGHTNGANFSKEGGIVTDHNTNLQWQDDYSDNNATVKVADWKSAINYCESLTMDGNNWRLPNKRELISILDHGRLNSRNVSLNPIFQTPQASESDMDIGYWSSTTDAKEKDSAWGIDVDDSVVAPYTKSEKINVRCVRSVE